MSDEGGAFFSRQLPPKGMEDPREVIRQYCLVWGKATLDAEDTTKRSRSVWFRVRYGEEPNPKYRGEKGEKLVRRKFMLCRVTGRYRYAAVMSAIEKGDMVMCLGRTKLRKVRNRKGVESRYYDMKVDVIFPMGLIGFLLRLYSSHTIKAMLEKEDDEGPDGWYGD